MLSSSSIQSFVALRDHVSIMLSLICSVAAAVNYLVPEYAVVATLTFLILLVYLRTALVAQRGDEEPRPFSAFQRLPSHTDVSQLGRIQLQLIPSSISLGVAHTPGDLLRQFALSILIASLAGRANETPSDGIHPL
jgi:hypothetical protein